MREEQAIFDLEIKKKSGLSIALIPISTILKFSALVSYMYAEYTRPQLTFLALHS